MPARHRSSPAPGDYDGDFAEFAQLLGGRAAPAGDRQAGVGGVEQGSPQTSLVERRRPSSGRPSSGCGRDYRQAVLVEEFIDGDEVTVGVVGNDPPRVVGVMRVVPKRPTERFVYAWR